MNQLSLATPAAARADQRVQDQNQVLALIDLIERGGGFPATPATGTIYSRLADRAHRLDTIDAVCRRGFREDDAEALRAAHRLLAQIYAERLRLPSGDERRPSAEADDIAELIETYLLGFEERAIDHGLVASAPRTGAALASWLRELVEQHPATAHPFYTDFMRRATKRDLEYYSIQETTLDPRFDDAMALLQLGTPDVAKMEIAKNYWDEMGNGEIPRIHTKLFQRVLDVLGITASAVRAQLRTESIACGNLSMTMVLQRCHFHKAIGYYGVTEYVVPFRFGHVVEAWARSVGPRLLSRALSDRRRARQCVVRSRDCPDRRCAAGHGGIDRARRAVSSQFVPTLSRPLAERCLWRSRPCLTNRRMTTAKARSPIPLCRRRRARCGRTRSSATTC